MSAISEERPDRAAIRPSWPVPHTGEIDVREVQRIAAGTAPVPGPRAAQPPAYLGPVTGEQLALLEAEVAAAEAFGSDPEPGPDSPHVHARGRHRVGLARGGVLPGARVFVIIPAHNEQASIAGTIRSVLAQTRMPDRVIVVPDHCTDATAAVAARFMVEIVPDAGSMSQGDDPIDHALTVIGPDLTDHDFVLCLDAGTLLEPRLVERCLAHFEASRPLGVVSAHHRAAERGRRAREGRPGRYVPGLATMFRASALMQVRVGDGRHGPVDGPKDQRLISRVRRLGWQVRHPGDLVVSHTPVSRHLVVLLPAHNEERDIGQALAALASQTRRPDEVIVIADNCTDGTARIAADRGAAVMATSGNTHKKAGALNYALERILPRLADADAVLVQDADSYLDPRFIEVTMSKLGDGYDAAGGNFRAREGGGACGWFQRNEYARYARDNARKNGRVLCITGVGTMFTVRALRAVAAAIADGTLPDAGGGYCYSYATLTEDNWMTLALKHMGFKFVSPKDATMSTEPMMNWRDLGRQRLRWKRGAFEDLLCYGLSRHTLKGWGLFLVSVLGVLATLVYLGTLVASPWIGFHPQAWFFLLTVLFGVERVVTVRSRGVRTQLLAATVVPEWFYDLFLQGVQMRALAAAVWRTKKHW
jgi:cellulose synthase/poly-beta-1,6-N-acetylglucosamine synthase-like glycosyltransferase